ncbi:MAG: response regulator transcription factor [Chitinophagaceae bacterium]
MPIRIAIADDHAIFRQSIISIATKYGFEVVAEAGNGQELITAIDALSSPPDVCILDVNMPVMNGYDTLAAIKKRWPDVPVLALSMHNAELPIIKMLSGGAGGYLAKDCSPRELKAAIETVVAQGFYHSDLVDESLVEAAQKTPPHITEKETLFLAWCCRDLIYKQIADHMGISVRTVESYAETLCGKLGVKSRNGLVIAAMQMGIKAAG